MRAFSEAEVVTVGDALRHLLLAGDRMRSAMAAQVHVNVTELTALGHLIESAELTPKQLARLLGITTGSVTGMVDRLEAAGLINRVPNPVDRRSVLVLPTSAGTQAVQGVYAQYHAALTHLLEEAAPLAPPELALALERASEVLAEVAQPLPDPAGRRPH